MMVPDQSFNFRSLRYQYQGPIDATSRLPHSHAMKSRRTSGVTERPFVTIVDDDESVRESLPDLLREFGFAANAYSSAEEFLGSASISQTKCLVLDIGMAGMNGLGLQRELKARGQEIPIVFITAQKDEAVHARAFEEGAVDGLLKPFSDPGLLAALNRALRLT